MKNPTYRYGGECWYNDAGRFHRDDGPAFSDNTGHKEYWCNGKLHRLDGPAIEYCDGGKVWYINGIRYSEENYLRIIKLKELL
jgi:hypothetical protein